MPQRLLGTCDPESNAPGVVLFNGLADQTTNAETDQ